MPIYRPDPRAYLQLRQTTPEWQMGDDVPIDENLPPTNTPPPTQPPQDNGQFIDASGDKNPAIKTRVTKQGKRVYHQRYYEQWQNGQYVGDVLIDPEPWLAEEPEDTGPEQFTDTITDPKTKAQKRVVYHFENGKPVIDGEMPLEGETPAEPRTKQVRVGENVWEYPTYKNPTTGQYEIDMSQSPTLVESAGPKEQAKKSSRTRQWQTADGTTWEIDEQQDPATGKWTAVDAPRVAQPAEQETPAQKLAREKAEYDLEQTKRDAINNPRNLSAALAYLSKNPLPTGRQLPDNGLDYGPQGGYTPTGKPLSQMLNESIAAQGTGANLIRVTRGSEMKPDVVRQGTDEYNFLTSNNLGQPVTTGAIVNKLPWNQQQVDSMTDVERASLGTLLSSQGIDPSELPDLTRRNVAFWNQASKEQQDEQLNATPDYRNALMADNAARVAPYLREQEARKQNTLSSALRGTGRRRY